MRVLFICVLVLLGLGVALFLSLFERREVQVNVGPGIEAQANRFLAAERLFERLGYEVFSGDPFLWEKTLPDPARSVLFLEPRGRVLTSSEVALVIGWVEAGGHLMFEPAEEYGVDPLSDQLNVFIYEDTQIEQAGVMWPKPLTVDFRNWFVTVGDDVDVHLMLSGDDGSPQGVVLRQGEGLVTALADYVFMDFLWIGQVDHAVFAASLLEIDEGRDQVYFLRQELQDSIWTLIARYGLPALLGLVLLVLLVIWRNMPRFGPVAPTPSPERRRLVEHLSASGRFLIHRGQMALLLASFRRWTLAELKRRHPGWADDGEDTLVARLVEHSAMSEARIRAALVDAVGDVTRFEKAVRDLVLLRSVL